MRTMGLQHERAWPWQNKRKVKLKLKEQSAVRRALVLRPLEDIHQSAPKDQQMIF